MAFVSNVMESIGDVHGSSKAKGHRVVFASQDDFDLLVVLLATFVIINVGHLGDSIESPFFYAKIKMWFFYAEVTHVSPLCV